MSADLKQGLNLVAMPPVSGLLGSTSATTILTCASSSTTKITTFSLTNKTSTAATVNVAVVPSGLTDDGTHTVVSTYSVPAHDSTIVEEVIGGFYPAGTLISVTAGTASAICYAISGLVSS